jgi:hypothetical protein
VPIPVLANRADLLAQALELANRETENATALNEEAAKAFESEKRSQAKFAV